VKAGETAGAMLLSEINVAYYQTLMHGIRDAIANGRFVQSASGHAPMGTGRHHAALKCSLNVSYTQTG